MHGKYCWFIDADDFIADNCLNGIIQMLESGFEMVSVGQAIIRSEENKERHYYLDKMDYRGARVPGYITLRILNSSLLRGLQFQLNLAYGQDEVFYFEVLKRKPKTNIFDHPIYFYRLSNEQSMNLNNDIKKLNRIVAIDNSMEYLHNKYSYSDVQTKEFINCRVITGIDAIARLGGINYRIAELKKIRKISKTIGVIVDKNKVFNTYIKARKETIREDLSKNRVLRCAYFFLKHKK